MDIQAIGNSTYVFMRRSPGTADEHEGYKKNIEFLTQKALESEALKAECEALKTKVTELETELESKRTT